jgi:4-deoxy-L-threo-5-hexosulose-uronate ketol-isomerase
MKEKKYRAHSPEETATASPEFLRERYMISQLFCPGEANLAWWEVDRTVIGGVVPLNESVPLEVPDFMRADAFLQRRELGVLNIGGSGFVTVGNETHSLDTLDGLYVGRGDAAIAFGSVNPAQPAKFYLLSYPAHCAYPTKKIPRDSVVPLELGASESANERHLYKVIEPNTVDSCQLVMGYTRILPGSAWNTMPPHTHDRRSEVYCYFNMAEDTLVVHLMGEPERTRNLIMRNEEVVLSPVWSIHCGAGTGPYSFIWGMGGENQDFTDMDHCDIRSLK